MKTAVVRAAVAGLVVALAACGRQSEDSAGSKAAAAAPPAATSSGAGYFTVPPNQLAHLQLADVRKVEWTTTLKTTGTVAWNNNRTTQAITQVSGPIMRLVVDSGSHVRAGQPLLYVASPDITSAISTYRKSKNRLDLAKRTRDRDQDLLEHKAISQRDLDQTQADYNDAATDVESALQGLHILGIGKDDLNQAEHQGVPIRPELPMRATIDGTIVQKLVLPGQVIQAGSTVAFVISDMATMWVQAHVYEKDLRMVHLGDAVDVTTAAYPEAFHGTVHHVGEMIDPATRTTPVRVVTANPRGLLKKDMFVDLVIHDTATRQALTVPTTAVLYDEQNLPFVYAQVDNGRFAERQVTIGAQQDDQTEILSGVQPGDRIVSQGSVFLQFANSYRG